MKSTTKFSYQGVTSDGKNCRGVIDANTRESAVAQLQQQGIFAEQLSAKAQAGTKLDLKNINWQQLLHMELTPSGVPTHHLTNTTRQLATLIVAGVPLAEALQALVEQSTNATLKNTFGDITTAVQEGAALHQAMANYRHIFKDPFVPLVQAAEASGRLGEVLHELADLLEQRQETANKLRSALTYPIIMLVIGTAVVIFLLTTIVPNMTQMFADLNATLPQMTQVLLNISQFIQSNGLILGASVIAAVVGWQAALRSNKALKARVQLFWLHVPAFGPLLRQNAQAPLIATLSTLLDAGVPVLDALKLTAQTTPWLPYQNALKKVATQVGDGESLADAFASHSIFPKLLVNMARVGERSGQLPTMLGRLAAAEQAQLKTLSATLTTLIQPLMLVLIGGLIAFIMIAVLLPMFQLNTLAAG